MAKAKVSVTVEEGVLRRALALARGKTRSEVFERALEQWVRARGRERLDREIERYYTSLTDEERREGDRWAVLGDETMRRSR
jgi:hypothetical protein